MTAVTVDGVWKFYGDFPALRDVRLEAGPGSCLALIGRNGAGKTTLLNLACGLMLPSEGSCLTLGVESRDLDAPQLTRLGVVHQQGRFIEAATVGGLLAFTAAFYPAWDKEREKRLIQRLEVPTARPIGELSPGDQQKVGILLGVCHHPSLLLLDEPVSAQDPIARTQMLEFLLELVREDSCTIVISSHILADVEKVVDWIACLDGGELAATGPLDEWQERYARERGSPLSLEQMFPLLIKERAVRS